MVAVLLQLKLAHLAASFRQGNAWVIVSLVISLLSATSIAGAIFSLGFFATSNQDLTYFYLIGGPLFILAWWVLALFLGGTDPTLDPEALAPYPIRRRDLMLGQGLASLLGVGGIFSLFTLLAAISSTFSSAASALLYLLSATLALVLAVLGARVLSLATLPLRARSNLKALASLALFALLIFTGPLTILISRGLASIWEQLTIVLEVIKWTPLGAPWGLVLEAQRGNQLLAWALAGLSLAYAALLWLIWDRLTKYTMERVGALIPSSTSSGRQSGLGLLGLLPDGPRWAVAARVLNLLGKDSRANLNIFAIPLLFLLILAMNSGTGLIQVDLGDQESNRGFQAVNGIFMLVGFLPGFAGYIYSYLVPYENTAFSLHVLSPLRGIDDRLGRVYAMCLIYLPLFLLGDTVFCLTLGILPLLGPILLTSLGAFLAGLGLGAWTDTLFSMPVAPPGSSPWATPQYPDGMAKTMLRGFLSLIPMALALPGVISLTVASFVGEGSLIWAWGGACLSLLLGAGLLVLGVRLGAAHYDRNQALMLQRVAAFSS